METTRSLIVDLLGEARFLESVRPHRAVIEQLITRGTCRDQPAAVVHLLRGLQDQGYDGFAQLTAVAACTEIMDPSFPPHSAERVCPDPLPETQPNPQRRTGAAWAT